MLEPSLHSRILGISAYYHDSAACVVVDGEVVAAAQEERFTRKKHDPDFPSQAVAYCLKEAGIHDNSQLDYVVFYDKPLLKFERLLETYLAFAPRGLSSFLRSIPLWLKQKLWIREHILDELGFDGKILFTEHHESHAASAFFPSPFSDSAILTIDGVGEWASASIGVGKDNCIQILKELHFPHSLGLLYSSFTYFTGFRVNSGEYKLMGLAPYGKPRYAEIILEHLVKLNDDGSFRLNQKFFNYCTGLRMTNRNFADLFDGPPREPESSISQREMDIAASIQTVTEQIMVNMARFAHKLTGSRNLVLAGGVALNCVGNSKIVREGIFEQVWIQPAAGDAGGALGAALFAYHQLLQNKRLSEGNQDHQKATLLGPGYSDEELGNFLREHGIIPTSYTNDDDFLEQVADLIAEGSVVGWFQGRMEFGPRALGNRSILADPRNQKMQTLLNQKIKFRESFRPFAPSILQEHSADYFDFKGDSPYMLQVADILPDKRIAVEDEYVKGIEQRHLARSEVPAITHVDYSARIHTVSAKHNPRFHHLLEKFYQRTNCPMLINTSFNIRGEPIVCTPFDAFRCFAHTNMDYLIIGKNIISRDALDLSTFAATTNAPIEPD